MPVPPGDHFVQAIAVVVVVHPDLVDELALFVIDAAYPDFITKSVGNVVCIEIGLHVEQLQLAVRCRSDGQRQMNFLLVGCCRAGIGRNLLVVDIHLTLHIPIVRIGIVGRSDDVGVVGGVAVIDDALRGVNEVA